VADDAAWRAEVVTAHPVVGRIATLRTAKPAVGPLSQSTTAWVEGAAGEELLGRHLAVLPQTVVVLHDRRVPGTKANIDHIAITPTGVFVVDAKNYAGRVEVRDVGSWFRPDERLYVHGRDRTGLLDGIDRQIETLRAVIGEEVPVHGVLCFVGESWPRLFRRPLTVRNIGVVWPSKLVEQLVAPGPLLPEEVAELASRVALHLPAA
jgi:hypothetical protein